MEAMFVARRKALVAKIKATGLAKFTLLLFSGFDCDPRHRFRVDNNFFYLTGHTTAGIVALLDDEAQLTFYQPNCTVDIAAWESVGVSISGVAMPKCLPLGQKITGFSLPVQFSANMIEYLLQVLTNAVSQSKKLIYCQNYNKADVSGLSVLWFFARLKELDLGISDFSDATSLVAQMRLVKDCFEQVASQRAIDICVAAHQKVMRQLRAGQTEIEVQYLLEQKFVSAGSNGLAFQSIVATGRNATVLHHHPSNSHLQEGELVVVDIGCESQLYSSDLTRTLPVSGKFSPRQKQLYQLVLEVQKTVEQAAIFGCYLNGSRQSASLHQLAVSCFKEVGYEQFFVHSIGHYMGLDVHDVGSYEQPIPVGAIFTIEPGIYLPQEAVGIRIEDNYLMTPTGAQRLSVNLCREVTEIEDLMHAKKF
jgi:Xaa-Pro aminopeptidase